MKFSEKFVVIKNVKVHREKFVDFFTSPVITGKISEFCWIFIRCEGEKMGGKMNVQ